MVFPNPLLAVANGPIPAAAGIGLKFDHIREIIKTRPNVAWFEIHAENFMSAGGPSIQALDEIRQHYPVSVHGIGLSLGSAESLDKSHLKRLRSLLEWVEPGLVSEHLAWCSSGGVFLNDLLPVPYEQETLDTVVTHVDEVQHTLGRIILIENPSLYFTFADSEMSEPEFLEEVAKRTGCGLLLDVNNVLVSGSNLGFDPLTYLRDFPMSSVEEIHLAGHHVKSVGGKPLRIDDHGSPVCEDVWKLYARALRHTGPVPSLIEWDTDVPSLETLLAEAGHAQNLLSNAFPSGGQHAAIV